MTERLLDHDASVGGQPRLGQPFDHGPEQKRRNLEVEDRVLRGPDRLADALIGFGLAEVALHVGESRGEALEDLIVDRLAGPLDRRARAIDELLDGPVIDRNADDRAVDQAPPLEPVQRAERHHLREVTGDPERDEHVCRLVRACRRRTAVRLSIRRNCHVRSPHLPGVRRWSAVVHRDWKRYGPTPAPSSPGLDETPRSSPSASGLASAA